LILASISREGDLPPFASLAAFVLFMTIVAFFKDCRLVYGCEELTSLAVPGSV
jgi:hypothetical protein